MGCNCNKSVSSGSPLTATRRVTVFEVQTGGATVAEFASLPEARAEALRVAGRVKVSSKVVAQ